MLTMKKVILGVTGGIAAYKAAELARIFIRGGSDVQVVMTRAAAEFVAPLTFQTLTNRPVCIEMYAERSEAKIRHIDLVEDADLLVIAPATANTIAKMAVGLADNLLTTLYLAATCPVVVVPSMNVNMFSHSAVRENLEKLRVHGCHVLDPDSGELACGVYGRGRMPEPSDIYLFCRAALQRKDYKGVKALVTAGPTREPFDPVRYLSNPSTGLMGYALARALSERGAEVTLVSGPTHLNVPAGVKLISITTADEMYKSVTELYPETDLVVKTAAVSDFRPLKSSGEKIKKNEAALTLELAPNPDILLELGQKKKNQVLVGFAAETGNAVEKARGKLSDKNLDLIVVNDLNEQGAGFAVKTNRVSVIDREGTVEQLPLMDKDELAHQILDRIVKKLQV
ncbi:MAG: bifunctional phosphopantothenoylcysteine decarboxylase/phosphopantothenate--cysteine ligase CoaBC [Bacillota bacterium]|nr:bifunctional phosphopantothenoylcysteine decarboxylase/phosphopantothenate--cysteine ligase CoaBC [Bacillota bacterium]MDW7728539.1 bifunctional phosphopantothenoylcysteine decarboxylase/phosphopantothenate--cysteine ligase CoaBC [Bacillota bacterium]